MASGYIIVAVLFFSFGAYGLIAGADKTKSKAYREQEDLEQLEWIKNYNEQQKNKKKRWWFL